MVWDAHVGGGICFFNTIFEYDCQSIYKHYHVNMFLQKNICSNKKFALCFNEAINVYITTSHKAHNIDQNIDGCQGRI